ncbi:neuronal acetylcholine receptor subunit alpha-9-I-like [Oncorhynchus nerka]|uniref:neuronal acetylcholine receptor subunit alpha-9-I-like n=1 Tax=Oncorhynchus nerka TaxID=8023 RepID=UPI0031B7F327
MTMITASTSLTIFIMNIHFCGAEAKPVPHWAKVLIIDYMSKILFVYEVGENCTTPESERTPLYSEEPMSGNSALARNHYHDDLYHDGCYQDDCHRLGPYQYGNGHLQNHLDNSRYANGGHRDDPYSNRSNRNHHSNPSQTSKGEGELDYQAPSRNLQNGGLNEPLPYPKEKHLNPASAPACSCPCPHHKQVVYNIQYIANCFREQRATCAKGAEWKKVAKVMDRFFMWIFFIMVFLMSILIIGKAT